jgi:hypothetical protein
MEAKNEALREKSESGGVQSFVSSTLALLKVEHVAEVSETQELLTSRALMTFESAGVLLRKLIAIGKKSAYGNRTVVVLSSARRLPDGSNAALPASRISTGDVVGVATAAEPTLPFVQGVVTRVSRDRIEVALDNSGHGEGEGEGEGGGKARSRASTAAEKRSTAALSHTEDGDDEGEGVGATRKAKGQGHAGVSMSSQDASVLRGEGGLWKGGLTLLKLANTVTHNRLCATARALLQAAAGEPPRGPKGAAPVAPPARHLLRLLYGGLDGSDPATLASQMPLPPRQPGMEEGEAGDTGRPLRFQKEGLNASQRAAIEFALRQPDLAVIHGPPGTGKTTTVVELIIQHVRAGRRVLVAAASNMAVDNVVERLLAGGVTRTVRLGHPARLLDTVQDNSFDALMDRSETMGLARDVQKDIDNLLKRGSDGAKHGKGSRTSARADSGSGGSSCEPRGGGASARRSQLKDLRRELREREARAAAELLGRAQVVCGTTATVFRSGPLRHVAPDHFDVAVVDEAGQALEVACWSALLQAPRAVLAGDHLQLPPTITSPEAAAGGLVRTLLDRVVGDRDTAAAVCLLDTQYRMHRDIQDWSSARFYDGRLRPAEGVATHRLVDLEGVEATAETEAPLWFVDTAGSNLSEHSGDDDISKANTGEAAIVVAHVAALVASGVPAPAVGVITPYNLQVEKIRELLTLHEDKRLRGVEVNSVDGFQGREKEAIVMSLVRSNSKSIIGFLADARRLNVAVTRARRHLCVVADSTTVAARDATLASLVDYLCERGELRTTEDYLEHLPPGLGDRGPTVSKAAAARAAVAETAGRWDGQLGREARAAKAKAREAEREARNTERRAALRATLVGFLEQARRGGPASLELSQKLTSWERRTAHELCEELGLGHQSEGHGVDRCLRVSWSETGKASAAAVADGEGAEEEQSGGAELANRFAALDMGVATAEDEGSEAAADANTTKAGPAEASAAHVAPPVSKAREGAKARGEEKELSDVQKVLRERAARLEASHRDKASAAASAPGAPAGSKDPKGRKQSKGGGQRLGGKGADPRQVGSLRWAVVELWTVQQCLGRRGRSHHIHHAHSLRMIVRRSRTLMPLLPPLRAMATFPRASPE